MSQLRAIQHTAGTGRGFSLKAVAVIAGASVVAAVAFATVVSVSEPLAKPTVATSGWPQAEFIRVNTALPALGSNPVAAEAETAPFLHWNTTALEYGSPPYAEAARGPR